MNNQKKYAFTLVEMLVVIAIIGILACMLMPSLMNSLATARTTVCLNNEKQAGIVLSQYSDDFNDYIIPLEYRVTDYESYGTILANNGYLNISNTDFSVPPGKEQTIFTCPSGISKAGNGTISSRYDEKGANAWRSQSGSSNIVFDSHYVLNSCTWENTFLSLRIPLDNTGEYTCHKRTKLRKPGKYVMMLDGYYSNFISRPQRINARHNKQTKNNALFVDGSARTQDILDIPNTFYLSNLNNNYPQTRWRTNQ